MTDDFSFPYYDRRGQPIGRDQYARLVLDQSYKVVARTRVGDYVVSTVWLGIDHSMPWADRVPIIFETMVFGTAAWDAGGCGPDFDCQRYSTEAAAVDGHRDTVTVVAATHEGEPAIEWEVGEP